LQNLFLTGGSTVARAQERAAEHSGTARHLYPGAAIRLQAKHCLLFRRQTSRPDIDILMHRDGTIASILRSNESPCALTLMERDSLLFITRHQTHLVLDDPNLQEMYGLVLRGIVFTVADSRSRAHPLHVARSDHRARSCAVFMRHGALQHVGDDFHVAVRVSRESAARINSIFVNDSQSTKAHVLRIVVI